MSTDQQLPEVPFEIITIILSKLPVESLLRFKCVSKPWLSLISSSRFVELHLKQMKQNMIGVYWGNPDSLTETFESFQPEAYSDDGGDYQNVTLKKHDLPIFENAFCDFDFVGSCNGLICMVCDCKHMHFVVFNPSTRQLRRLPLPKSAQEGEKYFFGFDYDCKIDDYKVVKGVTVRCNGIYKAKIEIFNLKSNSWRTIKDQHCSVPIFETSVFLNGVLHWKTEMVLHRLNGGNQFMSDIVRFDLVEERFLDSMSFPSHVDCYNKRDHSLMVIDECLCMCTVRNAPYFEVWKMVDYGVQNSWTRFYHLSFSNANLEECMFPPGLLYVAKTGHLLFSKYDCLMVYNLKDETIKLIDDDNWNWVESIVYIESLVSPNVAD